MMNYVKECKDNLSCWEQNIAHFLGERLPAAVIKDCLNECSENSRAFFESPKNQDISGSLRQAIAGLTIVRQLLEWPALSIPPCEVSTEDAAQFAFNSFQAGLFIGMACPGRGMEVFEWDNQRLRQIPIKANNARYADLREFKLRAKAVAKRLWEDGANFRHHEMVKHLTEDYTEDGKFPFTNFPGDIDKLPDKVLLKVIKEVAYEIGRPELVSGKKETQKKPKKNQE